MLTGRQILQARTLLKLNRSVLALMVGSITTLAIVQAEDAGDDPSLSREQANAVQKALEKAGVEFVPEGVRLRKGEQAP